MKAGRKSAFTPELGERLIRIFRDEGLTDAQAAKKVGVTERTLNNWKVQFPSFFQSLKEAKRDSDQEVEDALRHRAVGYSHPEEKIFVFEGMPIRVPTTKHYPPDTSAAIFWLSNRQPERWRRNGGEPTLPAPTPEQEEAAKNAMKARTFAEFCEKAGYPIPFAKQEEMRAFMMDDPDELPRMLLGSRGYGKTDYITILGAAFKIYQDRSYRVLILTKSKERNIAIVEEIRKALELNGVTFDKANLSLLRVAGLKGKDHSISAVTIKSVSLRGRHPDMVLFDDPVTEDDTSEATRKVAKKKWNETLKLVKNVGLIGQPAHKFDLYGELRGVVKTMEVPFGSIPELDHDLEAQRLAGVDEASIQASYFLKIANEGQTPFDSVKFLDTFPPFDNAVAFIDPSHEGGDFTAMSILGAYMQGVAVVGFAKKKAWNHCLDDLVKELVKYKVKRVAFETNALGDQPIIMLRELLTPYGIGVVGWRTISNKHSRILAAGAFAHQIFLSRESDKAYTDQVVQYEYKAKNDDAPDSLASGLEWIGLIRGKLKGAL